MTMAKQMGIISCASRWLSSKRHIEIICQVSQPHNNASARRLTSSDLGINLDPLDESKSPAITVRKAKETGRDIEKHVSNWLPVPSRSEKKPSKYRMPARATRNAGSDQMIEPSGFLAISSSPTRSWYNALGNSDSGYSLKVCKPTAAWCKHEC